MTRRHWLERQPLLLTYRRLLAGVDYRDRPNRKIHDFFWSHGYGIEATSQDGAKHLAALVLGRLRLRCVPCYGHYIGKQGLHWSPAFYAASGHADTQLCLTSPPEFQMPSDDLITHLLEVERDAYRQKLAHLLLAEQTRRKPPELKLPLDAEGLVRLLYRGFLAREPDAEGGQHHVEALKTGRVDPVQLFQNFLASREFRTKHSRVNGPNSEPDVPSTV